MSERLQFDFPGHRADAPRPAKIFQRIDRHVSERAMPGAFAERDQQSKAAPILPPGSVLEIAAVLSVCADFAMALEEALDSLRNRPLALPALSRPTRAAFSIPRCVVELGVELSHQFGEPSIGKSDGSWF